MITPTNTSRPKNREAGSDSAGGNSRIIPSVFWWGLPLGLSALLLRLLFQNNAQLAERLFSRGFFSVWRWIVDYTLAWIPFPLIYLIIPGVLIWLAVSIRKKRISNLPRPHWPRRVITSVLALIGWTGIAVFAFYSVWGFNYYRVPIHRHLDFVIQPLDEEMIRREAEAAHGLVVSSRRQTGLEEGVAVGHGHLPVDMETQIRDTMAKILAGMEYPVPGRVRVKKLWPGGMLMRFATSGFYLGFEGYVSDRLTATEMPFTLAHEMAHGYGFAEEGTANFLAALACQGAADPIIRYSGALSYWNYIGRDLYRSDPEGFREMISRFEDGIRADLRTRYENWRKYSGWLMQLAEKVGDVYLKSQGQRQGIKSYNRVVMLMAAWRNKTDKPSGDSDVLQSGTATGRSGVPGRNIDQN
jgi:hypothetical protein